MQTMALPPGPAEGFDLGGSEESLALMRDCFARFGDVYRIFAPSRGVYNYVINHPSDVKRVLLSNHRNYTKGEGMDRVKILLGNGIMTSEGEFWRRQRRMMQPCFHRRVIDRFSRLIHDVNEKFATRWAAKAAAGQAINLTDDVSELTLEIVLHSIFGSDLERLERQLGANPFEVVAKEQNRDLKFAFRFRSLTKLVDQLIERRRREPEEHFDFLSMLMAARDRESDAPMTNKEMIDEVMTLIVAGHETTAAALTWAWYLISQHRESAAQLEEEADRVTRPPLGLDAAETLSFTHQVLQEALRLYPPGWLFTRRTIDADELGGFAIGPRTDVFVSPYLLHRHPEFWSDPEEFRPERFAGADSEERHKFAYIPFAVGPRHCIGENLAMFEMLVHVQTMSRRFRLTRADSQPIELEAQINLRPRSPLLMTVEIR
ncbi:MAG: Unspecific monooxygenase [Gammaproteobacteria bacterium]|nr:Unspecific monooxygenase [Gammaproteobacteria bacterium]